MGGDGEDQSLGEGTGVDEGGEALVSMKNKGEILIKKAAREKY